MNKARTMHLSCNAPLFMWDEFILTVSYLSTLTTSKAAKNQTPYELWFGVRPSLSHLREIGCRAYIFTSRTNPKIAARSEEYVLIGYASNAKAYWCWHWGSRHIVDSYHITFVEHLNNQARPLLPGLDMNAVPDSEDGVTAPPPIPRDVNESTASLPLDDMTAPPALTHAEVNRVPRRSTWNKALTLSWEETNDGLIHGKAMSRALEQVHEAASWCAAAKVKAKDAPSANLLEENSPAETERDTLLREMIDEIILLIDVEDPDAPSWTEALESGDRDKWLEGAEAELNSLREMGVYKLVPCSEVPSNCSILRGKFVCWLKQDKVGNPVRHKVRWVAKGFQQVWGRDFSKTTSPTACLESLHIILHIAAVKDWCIRQYDVKTAFLYGILPKEETQFMEQPPGFIQPGKV
jgi:hypothetical protein